MTLLFTADTYTISINSNNITNDYDETFLFDLQIAFASDAEKPMSELKEVTEEEHTSIVSVDDIGQFPGTFLITLTNYDTAEHAESLYLYTYDESNDTLNEDGSVSFTDEGIVSFELTHGGDYLLSDVAMSVSPIEQYVVIGAAGVIILIAGAIYFTKKNKNRIKKQRTGTRSKIRK